jgi:hypothetical protein
MMQLTTWLVLLLECQSYCKDDMYGYAVEIQLSTYEAICLATVNGILVVEPAGDANSNLDTARDDTSSHVFLTSVRKTPAPS